MISTTGLSAQVSLKLIDRERDKFEASVEKDPINAREIKAFRERIGTIQSAEELVNDYEVYSFVMKAFNLEDQIFGKAMMKKIFQSDGENKSSLINKLTDARFKEVFKEMGFADEGTSNPNVDNPAWIEKIVDRYIDQKIINDQIENNEIVGIALHAQQKSTGLTSWYNVLADTKLQDFFYTALGFSDSLKSADVDVQVATLKKKFDIETLNDPGVFEKLQKKYVAIAQAKATSEDSSSNPILQLFASSSGTSRSIIEISLDGFSALRKNKY